MTTRAIAVCSTWRIAALMTAFLATALPACAQTLRIFHIDVEQADATLLVSPSGKTLLVDSGKNGHGPRIKAVMDQANVTTIDFFVKTHNDGGPWLRVVNATSTPQLVTATRTSESACNNASCQRYGMAA